MFDENQDRFSRLADSLEGRLPPEEAAGFEKESHDSSDPDAAWLRAFLTVSERTVIETPPPELHGSVLDLFESHTRRVGSGVARSLKAALTFDSGFQAAFGVRSAGATSARRLIFETEAADVALSFNPRPGGGGWNLDGQVLPRAPLEREADDEPPVARLTGGGTPGYTARIDELGEFIVEGVEPGRYDISVSLENIEVLLPTVELESL